MSLLTSWLKNKMEDAITRDAKERERVDEVYKRSVDMKTSFAEPNRGEASWKNAGGNQRHFIAQRSEFAGSYTRFGTRANDYGTVLEIIEQSKQKQ